MRPVRPPECQACDACSEVQPDDAPAEGKAMGHQRRTVLGAAAALLVGALAAVSASGLSGAPAAPAATLAQVAWIAGDWQGEAGPGALSQEVWAAPAGDCMMGMWRLVIDGKVKLFETLSITQEEGGPVLRLRHFGRDGVGWEERDKPLTLKVDQIGEGVVAFAGPGRSGPLRIVYRRTGDDTMMVAVEKNEGSEEFSFRRMSAWRGAPAPARATLTPVVRP